MNNRWSTLTTLSWYLMDNFPFLWFNSNKTFFIFRYPPLIRFLLTLFAIFICQTIFVFRITEYGQNWFLIQLFIVGTELDKIIQLNLLFQFQEGPIIPSFRLDFLTFWDVQHLSFKLIVFSKWPSMARVEFNVIEYLPCVFANYIMSNC